jgi:hypothetical protein
MHPKMKKRIPLYLISGVAVILLLLLWKLNPSQIEFDQTLAHGHLFTGMRVTSQSRAITYWGGLYYRKYMQVTRKNYFFFSLFRTNYGWYGTLRADGSVINPAKITDSSNYYYDKNEEIILGIFGTCIPLYNKVTLNFIP